MTKAHRHKGKENIKAVLFDFDGTLTVPGLIDFMAIKKAINCPDNSTILEYIENIASDKERRKADAVLEAYEDKAARMAKPNDGAETVVAYLKELKLKVGILTRNSMKSVITSLKSFHLTGLKDFEVIITREHDLKIKPHPEGVLKACSMFSVSPQELAVVGDYIYDIQAGRRAGVLTIFLESNHTTKWPDPPADRTIKSLDELRRIFGNEQ